MKGFKLLIVGFQMKYGPQTRALNLGGIEGGALNPKPQSIERYIGLGLND